METRSQEPHKQIGPTRAPIPLRPAERLHSRGLLPPRASPRSLPPELQIAADAGVPLDELMAAAASAPAGVSPLQALLAAGVIGEERYYRALAEWLGCGYYLGSPRFAEEFDAPRGLRCGVAPLAAPYGVARAVIAPRAAVAPRLIEMTLTERLRPESFVVTSPQRFAALVRAQRARQVLDHALGRLPGVLSAKSGLMSAQVGFIGLVASLAAALGAVSVDVLSMIASAALWIMFLASIAVRSLASLANGDQKRCRILSDDELPIYTVIAPVYREAGVVRQLVGAFDALNYPKSKLDIKLVVERGDRETLSRLLALDLPARYEVVVAPPGEPTTKPRALNLALAEARGDFIVVYDAEDIPAPGQLRLAASRFAAEPEVDCLQARLTVRNREDSWLSRLFSVEYAVLFDLINPGLCALGLPIALGGTSNHFRVSALVDVGGWDEWNVTEDADLGIRLARYGYKVGALDSDTSEEAPHELKNWFRQRVRWQKGWMQTCIVHSRNPAQFVRDLGAARAVVATVLIFGAVVSALLWPAFAASTLWRAFGPVEGELSRWREASDVFVYLLSFAGIFSILVPMIVAVKQRRLRVAAAAFALLPLYYGLVTLAAWTAIVDLIVRPHFWAKTEHGRAGRKPVRAGVLRQGLA
jgi:cellulose synthase/poly-beta-1,6-N-acetylglucosamine synthase-like glycosyltransferase